MTPFAGPVVLAAIPKTPALGAPPPPAPSVLPKTPMPFTELELPMTPAVWPEDAVALPITPAGGVPVLGVMPMALFVADNVAVELLPVKGPDKFWAEPALKA